jgi:Protein of unknown function (DUF2975)
MRSLRRADWLAELHALAGLAVLALTVGGLAHAAAVLGGSPIEVDAGGGDRPVPGLPADARVQLTLAHPTTGQRGWELLAGLPSLALVVVALVLLRRLVGRARRDDPFTATTVRGFRTLGGVLIVGGPVVWVTGVLARFALSATAGPGAASFDFTVPLAWLLGGFVMLAVGEIVARGRALRAELDTVV